MATLLRQQADVVGPQHPCYADGELDHKWEFVDDSFDHEYGTEIVCYYRCERCGATRNEMDFDPPTDKEQG